MAFGVSCTAAFQDYEGVWAFPAPILAEMELDRGWAFHRLERSLKAGGATEASADPEASSTSKPGPQRAPMSLSEALCLYYRMVLGP